MCQMYHFILLSELSIIAENRRKLPTGLCPAKCLYPQWTDFFVIFVAPFHIYLLSFIFTDTRLKKVRLELHAGLFFLVKKQTNKKPRIKHSQKSIDWISIFVLLVCVCWEVPQIFCGPRDLTFHWHVSELMTKYFFWTNCFLNIY